jgi:hypothetical protein
MATLTELIDTIAAVEGLERSTVNLIARYVREAGLITTGGRGTSAATMSLTDAANLLIGVNATTTAADAPKTVSAYRELVSYEPMTKADPRPPNKYGTLGEAIEQLVHATSVGELPEVFLHQEVPFDLQEAFPRGDVYINIKFRKSNLSAAVKIAPILAPDALTPELSEEWFETGILRGIFFGFYPPKLRGPPKKKKTIGGDRIEEITIGYRTLSAVGKLLLPKG